MACQCGDNVQGDVDKLMEARVNGDGRSSTTPKRATTRT